ncbi:DUF349 domain-containing protein [Kineococcus glutinatus]|uniref:DUF349 domain-containing protein n=1 Tax=Kineococcus glutinatus TaxID=1070872 RepID=A0ABP9I243_9ACTN
MSEPSQEPASTTDVQDTPAATGTPTAPGPQPVDAATAQVPGAPAAETVAETTEAPVPDPVSPDGGEPTTDEPAAAETPAAQAPEAPAAEAPADEAPADEAPAVADAPPVATPASVPHPSPETGAAHTSSADAATFGRVDADGTVWVRRKDGEHEVGQYPGASPEEALAYFVRKFEEVVAQVDLFEQRLRSTELSSKDIVSGVAALRTAVAETRAVGDVDGLAARVEALATIAEEARAAADRLRHENRERLRALRTAIVEEAEQIAAQDPERVQWKGAGERLRELFAQWQAAQREGRLDKRSEEELWKRFSHARSAFDKARRHHFAALNEQRGSVRAEKEKLVAEAEELSTSTDWRGTSSAYRQLMDRWKAAGRLARKDDDALWARFRAAQDAFFAARTAANEQVDEEFRGNLQVKEQLLVEAEALVPVRDLGAAKAALRDIQERWEAAGKVPRADLGRVEGRLRAVENAVRDAEQERWKRSNPEARARAQGVVAQLEAGIRDLQADVEAARARGDARRLKRAEEALRARQEWLEQARGTLRDVTG